MHRGIPLLWAGPYVAFALSVCTVACVAGQSPAEPRFGDSTWVAPAAVPAGDPSAEGPRVAAPDHEPVLEKALRTPFRIAFLPLRGIARGLEAAGPLVERFAPPGKSPYQTSTRKGLHFSPALSYSGAAGPGFGASVNAPEILGPGSRVGLTGTWSIEDNRRARLRAILRESVSPIGVGFEGLYDYRPNRRFYGIGNFSPSERTIYLRRDEVASAFVFLGKHPLRRARVTGGISDISIGRGYNDVRKAEDNFDPADVPFLTRGSRLSWYGAAGDFAALDDSLHPSLGFHVRPELRRLRSTDGTGLRYDHWRMETRAYVPVWAPRRVVALRMIYEGVDPRGGSAAIPFYRLPESSDANRFAAYPPGRFRDQRLALGHAEYRWRLLWSIWAVAFGQLGEVAPTPEALSLRRAHRSLGGGLRMHIGNVHTARVELANGDEGLNFYVDLKGDF